MLPRVVTPAVLFVVETIRLRRLFAVLLLPALVGLGAILPEKNLKAWVEVNTPNFRVISNTETSDARDMAYGFEQARALFNNMLSNPRPFTGRPVTVIVAKDEGFVRRIWPEEVKMGSDGSAVLPVFGAEKFYFLVRQVTQWPYRFTVVRGDTVLAPTYRVPIRAFAHVFIPLNHGPLPLWMETGLRAFYANSLRISNVFRVGGPPVEGFRFAGSSSLSMETLLRLDSQSPILQDKESARAFHDKSWALVQFMRFSLDTAKPNSLMEVIEHVQNGADVQDAVREFVGDPAQLQTLIAAFLKREEFASVALPIPPRVKLKEIPVRALPPHEVAAVLGDFYLQGGWHAAARQQLTEALRMSPDLPQALESLAWLEHLNGNEADALEMIQQALQKNSESYLGHFYFGAIQEARAKSERELVLAQNELRRALALNPDFAPAYHILAKVNLKTGKNLAEAFQNAQHAINLDPGVSEYYLTTAEILLKASRADLALSCAKLALLAARTRKALDAASAMLESLPKPHPTAMQDAPAAPSVSQNRTQENSPARPQLKRRPAPVQSAFTDVLPQLAATRTESGTISSVTCHVFAMDLTLVQPNATLRLHSDNLVELKYFPDRDRPWDFDPCTKLAGGQTRVTFTPRARKNYDGEIISIQLVK